MIFLRIDEIFAALAEVADSADQLVFRLLSSFAELHQLILQLSPQLVWLSVQPPLFYALPAQLFLR